MNEEEFRRAIRTQIDAHIQRLRITYAVLLSTAEVLQRLAREGGVDEITINAAITAEAGRVEEALDDLAQPTKPAVQPVIH
ncbi:hypothetical protein [Antarcticimicrobium sediminis]|uniref:Uncharacterized protein n=1 Tax=Antarcticimicrobium sediminis TaxID=2546227 RepID=A0A4R5F0S3_9RHOB|nr:hypothetical protein [Antarcticimicrobium sediminis]TDE40949.1 hypothetical protein E1B25_01680 [Antarcticimicrobium sediminis]